MMNPIPRQYELKTIIEEPSSTENLSKVVIHSLFTCYFVNTPHLLNGGSILIVFLSETRNLLINYVFIHPAFELCKKNGVF